MTIEIPSYGLKAYALFFSRHGSKEEFKQTDLDWIVSTSMKKKIFSLLVRTGWIKKRSHTTYSCIEPSEIIKGLLQFRVPEIMSHAERNYAFTQSSAVEIWSDFSYVQRGKEKSPYYVKVLKKDVPYWKEFFHKQDISVYIKTGTTIGEFIILVPVQSLKKTLKNNFYVEPLQETMAFARSQEMYAYAVKYMQAKRRSKK